MTHAAPRSPKFSVLPRHIAIVPDGNGRWAERQGFPRLRGHQVGAENTHRLINYLTEYPIKYVTLYGFSTENWSRPEDEVHGLFDLLAEFIEKTAEDVHRKGVRLNHIGRLYELPENLQKAIKGAIDLTRSNTGMVLTIAFNYGSRTELVDAVRRLVADGVSPEQVNEKLINSYLYTDGLPDVDLLIRTGDELRLSNFLIWQTTYSEYHFTKVLWPDFGRRDIVRALESYSHRKRRFGGL